MSVHVHSGFKELGDSSRTFYIAAKLLWQSIMNKWANLTIIKIYPNNQGR